MTDYEKNLFETRYRKDESEKSWNDVFKRVADTIGKTDEDKKEYYDLMSEGWFLPSSPQLWNFGAGNNSGSSCFTMHIGDTLEEIYQADWEACQVYKQSGGCGYELSSLRPRGSVIHGSPNKSVGIISVLQRLERTTAYITAGGRCLNKNTLLYTKYHGLIPIKDIKIDELVLTQKGYKKVTNFFEHSTKQMYNVLTKNGYEIISSLKHKYYVFNGKDFYLKPLEEIDKNKEKLCLLLNNNICSQDYLLLNSITPEETKNDGRFQPKNIKLPNKLDCGLAFLLGFFHANGNYKINTKTGQYSIRLHVAPQLETLTQYLTKYIKDTFDIESSCIFKDGRYILSLSSKYLLEFLLKNNLINKKNCYDVDIPEAIMKSNSNVQMAFVAGYFDGDGSNNKNNYEITSVSKNCMSNLQKLLLNNGIPSVVIKKTTVRENEHILYRLMISSKEYSSLFYDLLKNVSFKISQAFKNRSISWSIPINPRNIIKYFSKDKDYKYYNVETNSQKNTSRERLDILLNLAIKREDNDLISYLNKLNLFIYEELAEIKEYKNEVSYDIEVEDEAKFSANGFYVSNSRGALMLQLDVSHPDILEFITCKKPLKIIVEGVEQWDIPLQNVNISVRCSDEFMEAVKNDKPWILQWKDNRQELVIKTWEQLNNNLRLDPNDWKDVNRQRYVKYVLDPIFEQHKGVIKAKQLWDIICECAHSFADPGIVFTGNIEKYNPHPSLSPLFSNPCQPTWAKVLTLDGIREFKDIDIGSLIWSKEGFTVVTDKWSTGIKDVWEYKTENGSIFYGTENHRVLCRGEKIEVRFTDSIDTFKEDSAEIVTSKIISKILYSHEEVFDITVDNSSHTYWTQGCDVSNCSEFIGPKYSSCNLGSMNLRKFFINGKFDWEEYSNKICQAVRYLNDVLDYNELPVKEINRVTHEVTRPIGLGIMKFADLLILEKIRYGSEQAIKYAKDLMAFTTAIAWQESLNLGRERAHPQSWNKEKMIEIFLAYGKECSLDFVQLYDQLAERVENGEVATNTVVTSIAPTGSIAQICAFINVYTGESSGIEPIFSWETYRKDASGETIIKHDLAPKNKKENWHVVAEDITPEEHVRMQAAFSNFTSMSVSKTLNLANSATVKNVSDAYQLAWELGVKGTTVYRDGSKPIQVLTSLDKKTVKETNDTDFIAPDAVSEERPDRLYGFCEKIPVANGNIYLTVNSQLSEEDYWTVRRIIQNRGKMAEVFISHGKSGTDVSGYLQAIGRLISLDLRKGNGHITLDDVLDTIEGISFSPSWYKSKLTQSPIDAIVKAINRERELREKAMGKGKEEKKKKEIKAESCSVCGKEYRYTDGCKSCNCGSKCG